MTDKELAQLYVLLRKFKGLYSVVNDDEYAAEVWDAADYIQEEVGQRLDDAGLREALLP